MPWSLTRRGAARLSPVLWSLAALFLLVLAAGCGGNSADTEPPPPPPPPIVLQQITIRVLDVNDQPVVGARMNIQPLHGYPTRPEPFFSDRAGDIQLVWTAEVKNEKAAEHSQDMVYHMRSAFEFEVHAATYLPHYGVVDQKDSTRVVHSRTLKMASLPQAVLQPYAQTDVLHHPEELFAGDLAELSPRDPLVAVCLAFYADNRAVFDLLGARFAWPTFRRMGDTLRMRFIWKGATWGGLGPAPLAAQVASGTGIPILMAAGEDLLPLAGVNKLAIEMVSKITPADDPHAKPQEAVVRIVAPSDQIIALGEGRMTPAALLAKNQPKLLSGKDLEKLKAMEEAL